MIVIHITDSDEIGKVQCVAGISRAHATSANQSGRRPATDVAGLSDLTTDSRLFVLDGGPTPGGAPSTLVDARGTAPVCLRAGAIAWDRVVTSR